MTSHGIRTDACYKGEFALLYFGFTYCPDICPSELVKVGKVIDGLGMFIVGHVILPKLHLAQVFMTC